ncbi:hypothetical protein IKE67_09910 [bacterium]|nr:hypothetical protein [bacterium]
MNYSLFLKISLIIAIIATIGLCVLEPKMHKTVLVYDSSYKIIEHNIDTTVEKNIPTVSQTQELQKTQQKVETTTQKQNQTPKQTTVKLNKDSKYKPIETKKQTLTQPKTLTEQEEEIEWNKWRSNLQNQIMKDVKLPIIPQGTVFKFEFDVDMYGKVSNVQTMSLTHEYTPYAIQYIAPVIRSYQGHSILNFPQGSKRTQTHVKGGWKIAQSARYSTPKDYNDTEQIKK